MHDENGRNDPTRYRELVSQSMEELRLKTAAHDRLWHLGDAEWILDQDAATIAFSTADGLVATCPVQIIGTFNAADSTWLWSWDHPSVEPLLRDHATLVRAYGEAHDFERLTTRKLTSTEDECWEFTALACKLANAQGAYRGPAGSTLVFMTFGEPKLKRKDQ
jgi:hypothetical protein